MTREPTYGPDVIRDQFHNLAERLEEPTTVYLIGGGALTLQGLKNATRDIDIIVEQAAISDRLYRALTSEGYTPLDEPEADYTDLETAFILQQGPRRFDVFNQQVAGVLRLSTPMIERSERWSVDGPLTVKILSSNDVFLFKSVANREEDVEDMIVLAERGIDERVIMDEVMVQLDHLGDDQFIRSMKHKLDRLAARGYSFDIHNEVDTLYEVLREADEVASVLFTLFDAEYRADDLFEGVPRSRLREQIDTGIDFPAALAWLGRTNRIREADDESLVPVDDV